MKQCHCNFNAFFNFMISSSIRIIKTNITRSILRRVLKSVQSVSVQDLREHIVIQLRTIHTNQNPPFRLVTAS